MNSISRKKISTFAVLGTWKIQEFLHPNPKSSSEGEARKRRRKHFFSIIFP
jgi:hypothetical protein